MADCLVHSTKLQSSQPTCFGCTLNGGCDLQFHSSLPLLPLIITAADGVRTTVTNLNIMKSDVVVFHFEPVGDSSSIECPQSVLSIFSKGRVRDDGKGHIGTTTSRDFQVVTIKRIFWQSCEIQ